MSTPTGLSAPVPSGRTWSRHRILCIAIPSALALAAGFVVAVLCLIESMMHSSEAYRMALKKAADSPCVLRSIGAPIQPAWLVSGNLDLHNSDGDADLEIPLSGPRGKGSVHIKAEKKRGIWRVDWLDFEDRTGRMQLIPETLGDPCSVVNPAFR